MSARLPTGIISRINTSGGKERRQFRAYVSDSSQRTKSGKAKQVGSRWFDKLGDAKEWRETKQLELRSAGTLAPVGLMTVKEAVEDWLDVALKVGLDGRDPVSNVTGGRYKSSLDTIIAPTIGKMKLGEISPQSLLRWRDDRVRENGHDAAKRALDLLKRVLRYQTSIGGLRNDPGVSVRLAARKKRVMDDDDDLVPVEAFMSPADVHKIIEAVDRLAETGVMLDEDPADVRSQTIGARKRSWGWTKPLISLLVACGPRMGEVAALRWGDIDFEEGTINIERSRKKDGTVGAPKTLSSIRIVTMGPRLAEALQVYKDRLKDVDQAHYVFGNDPRRPLDQDNFGKRQWKMLMRECGMVTTGDDNVWTPHDCRHYHASTLILKGVADQLVADRLGHANTIVTRTVYAHLFKELAGKANRAGADLEDELLG